MLYVVYRDDKDENLMWPVYKHSETYFIQVIESFFYADSLMGKVVPMWP